jgi:hypothetical protein
MERDGKDGGNDGERGGRASIPERVSEPTDSPDDSDNSVDIRTERCNDILEIGGSITWRSTPANRTRTRAVKLGKEKEILTIHSEVTPKKGETYETMLNQ